MLQSVQALIYVVQVIRPFMLRRTKVEVEKELPSKTAVVIKCGQSAWQSVIYSQISDQVSRNPTPLSYESTAHYNR